MRAISDHTWDLHMSGVHIECRPADVWARTGRRIGDGTPRKCVQAGRVERFHSHEFDGLLVCGCSEDA